MLKKITITFIFFLIILTGLYVTYSEYENIEEMTWQERQALYCKKISYELEADNISHKNIEVLADSPVTLNVDKEKYKYVLYSYDSVDENQHYVNLVYVSVKDGRPILSSYITDGSEVIPFNIPFSCDYIGISEGTTNYSILFGEFYDDNISCMQIYYTDGTMQEKNIKELGDGYIFITKYDFEEDELVINRLIALDQYGETIADCPQVDIITQAVPYNVPKEQDTI